MAKTPYLCVLLCQHIFRREGQTKRDMFNGVSIILGKLFRHRLLLLSIKETSQKTNSIEFILECSLVWSKSNCRAAP